MIRIERMFNIRKFLSKIVKFEYVNHIYIKIFTDMGEEVNKDKKNKNMIDGLFESALINKFDIIKEEMINIFEKQYQEELKDIKDFLIKIEE